MNRLLSTSLVFACVGLIAVSTPAPAMAATGCDNTSTGNTALTDLGAGTYQGEQGGLYPGGSNQPPAAYRSAGVEAARSVVPRDASGAPASNGSIVLLSLGMSNAQQEFEYFKNSEANDSQRGRAVALVNGAQSGQDASAWTSPSAPTWETVDQIIASAGFTPQQVQAVWLKQAIALSDPPPDFPTYIHTLEQQLAAITSIAGQRYPNLRQVFVSARTYGGYAVGPPNPEPWAYQTGFADKWLVAQSVVNPGRRPWVGWGPYFWTDGTRGRADGLQWLCSDTSDGTHPSDSGMAKINTALHSLFVGSPFTPWFTGSAPAPNPAPSPAPNPAPNPAASPDPATNQGSAPGSTTTAPPVASPGATSAPTAGAQPDASPGAIEPVASPGTAAPKQPDLLPALIYEANAWITAMPPTERALMLVALVTLIVVNGVVAGGLLRRRLRRPAPIGRPKAPPKEGGGNGIGVQGNGAGAAEPEVAAASLGSATRTLEEERPPPTL